MILRKVKKDDFNDIVEIINRNYDQEVINFHPKEIIEKFRKGNTVESLERQATWKEIFVVEEDGEMRGSEKASEARLRGSSFPPRGLVLPAIGRITIICSEVQKGLSSISTSLLHPH